MGGWLAALVLTSLASATPPRLGMAYFYKPPTDGTPVGFIAHHYQLILLTHGDEAYAARLRQSGYAGPILQTVAANEAEGPGPYANARARCDERYRPYRRTVADREGVYCRQLHAHESWFLHNRKGERLYSRWQSAGGIWRTDYEMNPASPGWRRFVIARLRQYRAQLDFDGFFFDNVDLSRAGLLLQMADRGGVKEFSSDAEFRTAVAGYLQAIHAALPGVRLWANLTHDPDERADWDCYLPYLNGVMVEDFALGWKRTELTPRARLAQLANIQAALQQGKRVLLVVQGEPNQEERRRFTWALAWALLPSAGGLYYRYNDGATNDYRQVWWSALYEFLPPAARGPLRCQGLDCRRPYADGVLQLDLAHGRVRLPAAWLAALTPTRSAKRRAPPPGGR